MLKCGISRSSIAFFAMIWIPSVGWAGTFPAESRSNAIEIQNRVLAAHFLSHATFGATEQGIEELALRMDQIGVDAAKAEWIDNQLSIAPTHHLEKTLEMYAYDGFTPIDSGINTNRYKYHAWWDTIIDGEDQLRQRMAWALAQIFAIDRNGNGFQNRRWDAYGNAQNLGIVNFYDTLVDGALGNYREVLQEVTLHPVMGQWLSHVRNRGDEGFNPDENYAREVQQLFTIGLYLLKSNGVYERDSTGAQIASYTNAEVQQFAKVFTGLHHAGNPNRFYSARNDHDPMIMFERYHNQDEKVLHNGTVLPAGQPGMQDISQALDNLFEHNNCAPFVSRLLIQRLVTSNPSKGYIRRVAAVFADDGSGVRGNLAAVAKAILMDKEAEQSIVVKVARGPWRVEVSTNGTEYSRLQEPVVRYASMIRALRGASDYPSGRFMVPDLQYHLHQMPYQHHHVFNFYDVEHVPGELFGYETSKAIPNGVLFAPEFQIFTAVPANRLINRFRSAIIDGNEYFTLLNNTNGTLRVRITFDLTKEIAMADDMSILMQHLDLLLTGGTMRDETRNLIAGIIDEESPSNATTRARSAILAILISAEAAVRN